MLRGYLLYFYLLFTFSLTQQEYTRIIRGVMVDIDVVVFCYRGEEELLPMSLGRLHAALPEARIHIMDDGADPIREEYVRKIKNVCPCTYRTTYFDRKRNLNGKECVVGELECMLDVMSENVNEDGYVIKMDPDTLVLRPDLILEAIDKGAKWISHNSMKGHFAGMFYVIHRSILESVLRNARVMSFPEHCAEDETIGALCYIAAAQGAYSWTDISIKDNTRKFAALPIQMIDTAQWVTQLAYVAKEGHIITVGNSALFGLPKSYQTKAMRDLLNVFYNYDKLAYDNKWPDIGESSPCKSLDIVNLPVNNEKSPQPFAGDAIFTGRMVAQQKFVAPVDTSIPANLESDTMRFKPAADEEPDIDMDAD